MLEQQYLLIVKRRLFTLENYKFQFKYHLTSIVHNSKLFLLKNIQILINHIIDPILENLIY